MIETVTQLLIPDAGATYRVWDLTSLLMSEQGLAIPPVNYLTQRGPYQHGDTVVGMRLEPRVIQLVLSKRFITSQDYHASRQRWIADLSSINTGDPLTPLRPYIYRKILYQRYKVDLADLVLVNGSATITSASSQFIQHGLTTGCTITVTSGASAGTYTLVSAQNENTLVLNLPAAANESGQQAYYYTQAVVREIDVLVDEAPHLSTAHDTLTRSHKEVLRLAAHDPIWRDPVVQSVTWIVDIAGNLIFYESPSWTNRAVFPIWFSGDFVISDTSLTYAGTWPTRPTITLTGPFNRFKLVNTSTGDNLILNYQAAQGETVTIDLYALYASNQAGANLTNYLYNSGTQDSDLVTFQLAPHPIVVGGVNQLHIEINGALPATTSAALAWQSRYIGV